MSQSSSDRTNDPPGVGGLTENDRHRVLASERRRILLDVLAERATPVGIEEAAAAVVDREGGAGREGSVDRVAITLHHKHLPRLDELGVLDYDRVSNQIVTFRRS